MIFLILISIATNKYQSSANSSQDGAHQTEADRGAGVDCHVVVHQTCLYRRLPRRDGHQDEHNCRTNNNTIMYTFFTMMLN